MKKILLLGLVGLLLLSACTSKTGGAGVAEKDNEKFAALLDELLADSYNPDDFSINFTFIDPEKYGVERELYNLGFNTEDDIKEGIEESKDLIKQLNDFKDKDLSYQQQLDRNALVDLLERSLKTSEYYDFEVGTSVLGSSRSLMGNIPAYLEKYEFHDELDVQAYLNFMTTLKDNFQKYVNLEIERQERNTGYSQIELDDIIDQASSLATDAKADDYYLIDEFNTKINNSDVPNKEDYIKQNKTAINQDFSDAFNTIAAGLSAIEAPDMTGLANKPNGKEYYEALLQSNTGSSRSIKDIELLLARHKMKNMLITQQYAETEEALNDRFDAYLKGPTLQQDNGKDLINYLNANYRAFFPETDNFNYELRKVHASMEEASSPAFYFSPQIDYTDDYKQVIFVKGDFNTEDYRTYGHESTPGHMYQFTYFLNLPSHPLLKVFTSSANAEGWANYSEQYIDYMLGLDEDQAEFNQAYSSIVQILHIEMDIGINYYGWDIDEFKDFVISNFGLEDEEEVLDIYKTFVHNPAAFPTYYLSNLYIQDLKTDYFKNNPDSIDVDFHKEFLKYGSVGFDVIEAGFKKDAKK